MIIATDARDPEYWVTAGTCIRKGEYITLIGGHPFDFEPNSGRSVKTVASRNDAAGIAISDAEKGDAVRLIWFPEFMNVEIG